MDLLIDVVTGDGKEELPTSLDDDSGIRLLDDDLYGIGQIRIGDGDGDVSILGPDRTKQQSIIEFIGSSAVMDVILWVDCFDRSEHIHLTKTTTRHESLPTVLEIQIDEFPTEPLSERIIRDLHPVAEGLLDGDIARSTVIDLVTDVAHGLLLYAVLFHM
jgi:hypothetical protein